ncbi:hypothetical protein NDA11_004642 [Ustilago hordei]|uniref:Uncharacterized protein n=1 Tax=Ustilago hordei TaxID=120017 RepID=I2G580_USTHO|nr:uncharacterized protein UHO2_01707 [Ustilago hordei]KAJ1039438.1 hypothetical protein NDA10_000468 [Ustilago hordei]KAJ1586260.1 hypothetical protein NDA12_006323 [Ustilago hordei]KAJ1589055.1 hypothetical protein NDA15_001905 [Ustilago hordei]KAJ1590965.1 hypothetical protein NDA11_004642 [Ustilago hordei]KAJ1600407.1 hypothetical protein NDA14_000018 [Ustilago hordei]
MTSTSSHSRDKLYIHRHPSAALGCMIATFLKEEWMCLCDTLSILTTTDIRILGRDISKMSENTAYTTAPKASALVTTIVAEATGFAAFTESYGQQPASQPTKQEHVDLEATEQLASATSALRLNGDQARTEESAAPEEDSVGKEGRKEEPEPRTQKKLGTQSDIEIPAGLGTTVSADNNVQAALAKERGQTLSPLSQGDAQERDEDQDSEPARPPQPQQENLTGSTIQTCAGIGTTTSPDDDNQAAIAKERSNRGQAPSTTKSGTVDSDSTSKGQGNPGWQQGSGIPTAAGDGTTLSPDDDVQAATKNKHSSATTNSTSSSSNSENCSESSGDTPATEHSATNHEPSSDGRVGWKDKLKGQAKIVAGKISRNEEKVELGREIKAGHH